MDDLLKGVSVFLIGMMGTGKTTVGQLLAQRLGYHFFDTDGLIVKVTQKSIRDLFATEGEAAFREVESQILAELSAYKKSVIATGGGAVLKSENWGYLHHGLIIWLDSPISLLCQRLQEDQTRPLLQDTETDLEARLDALMDERRGLYAQGDLQISIKPHHAPEDIVAKILERIPTILKSSANLPDHEAN